MMKKHPGRCGSHDQRPHFRVLSGCSLSFQLHTSFVDKKMEVFLLPAAGYRVAADVLLYCFPLAAPGQDTQTEWPGKLQ